MVLGLSVLIAISIGCGRSPVTASGPPASLSVTSVSPNTGSTRGETQGRISGTGFRPGARVTIGGVDTIVRSISATVITVILPAHAEGVVDITVANPSGESSTLRGGFTYIFIAPPVIASLEPTSGSIAGGAPVMFTGTGFQPGATVSLDGPVDGSAFVQNSTTIWIWTRAHAAGTVDAVVTNPDGQSGTLAAAFTYADPTSFDFNGEWEGSAYSTARPDHVLLRFTVRGNTVVSVSCDSTVDMALTPPPIISAGRFSFAGASGARMTGRIVSPTYSDGTINIAPCVASGWDAVKRLDGAQPLTKAVLARRPGH
jgi:hypothetical protein